MSSQLQKKKSVVQVISAGIAGRGFQIVPDADEIPGCRGNKGEKLERVQEFAREHGWHVNVHEENGWLLFTADRRAAAETGEDGMDRLSDLMALWLYDRRFSPKLATAHSRGRRAGR